MPIHKLVIRTTILAEGSTLQEVVDSYGSMNLNQIHEAIHFGDDIGSPVEIVSAETLSGREAVVAELEAIGDDGSFFNMILDDEEAA